ncbi:glucose-1-phosphate thymidylyltransferase [Saccharopolyspora taberi]
MKALVLSGGKGTRLRPFTHSLAKQLVPVANKPVLVHCLETIRDIGVREVGIIVGDNADEIEKVIGGNSAIAADMHITYIKQDQPLGLAHCVLIAEEFLADDDFVMYLGDNVLGDGIGEAARRFRQTRPDAHLLAAKVSDPRQYGVVEVDHDGIVRALVEKPEKPRSDLAVMGVYFFTPAIHRAVRSIRPSGRGELEITDAIQHLVSSGAKVTAEAYPGYWKDTGSIDDLIECNRVLLDRCAGDVRGQVDERSELRGPVIVEEGATVSGSDLVGPLVIGAGSVVTDSRVGPYTAVERDCVITGSAVENSILLEGARVLGVAGVRDSVVGRWAHVRSAGGQERNRVLIGDHASVEVAA